MPTRNEMIKEAAKTALLKPAPFFNRQFAYVARIEMALSRGALNVATRQIDPLRPTSWEFSAFSQNGEDGVVDYLLSRVSEPDRYFVEIGASDGLENNSSYLALAKKYNGLMVEGDPVKSRNAKKFLQPMNWSVDYVSLFVEPKNVDQLLAQSLSEAPDFFSLDIDSNDYFVMRALLSREFRPKVVCVEYNSAFGPEAALSIAYTPCLNYLTHHASQLYYGVSIRGWRCLFKDYGYTFVSVESRGINAFFVDSQAVTLPEELRGLDFAENQTQYMRHRVDWKAQFQKIASLPFEAIAPVSRV